MKNILVITLVALLGANNCVEMVKGVFKGSYWRVTNVNVGGTYDLEDIDGYILKEVRASYVVPAEDKYCQEKIK